MLDNLQLDIHYTFHQVKRLREALTHSSYVNENRGEDRHNERLEFLGDAVLELCVSQMLYRRFPDEREGELTAMRSRLVSQGALAGLARRLKLDGCLLLGRGEESQGGRSRDALLSDALEAVFGAIFLDGGFEAVCPVIENLLAGALPALDIKPRNKDHKSRLQEVAQKIYQDLPVYALTGSEGPEHAKIFRVRLLLPDGRIYDGAGPSLKRAEQAVAALALADLENSESDC
jgi:ribonuclease-3